MPLISLIGPSAIGKTTALRRWCKRYSRLIGVDMDLNLVMRSGEETRKKGWSGTQQEKQALLTNYATLSQVVVATTSRNHPGLYSGPIEVIVLTCSPESFEANMRARCAAKGKKYREDYWEPKKLEYEASRRYLNAANSALGLNGWRDGWYHFEVSNQVADWPAVDELFGKLYRKWNNVSNKGAK